MTPALPFETFLELFAPLADYDEKNHKHPGAALAEFCPRSKTSATEKNRPQWTAKQVVDFTSLYVDVIRAAETEGTPIPLTFAQFLERFGAEYLAGGLTPEPTSPALPPSPTHPPTRAAAEIPPPLSPQEAAPTPSPPSQVPSQEAPKARSRGRATLPPSPPAAGPGTLISLSKDVRVIYTAPSGRTHLAVVTAVNQENGKHYADFLTDDGELFEGMAISSLAVSEVPLPAHPAGPDGKPMPIRYDQCWRVPMGDYRQMLHALSSPGPMGNIEIGKTILELKCEFPDHSFGAFAATNGETGPYLDAFLVGIDSSTGAEVVIADTKARAETKAPTRSRFPGVYVFHHPEALYRVKVEPYER